MNTALKLAPATAFQIPTNPIIEVSRKHGKVLIPYVPEIAAMAPDAIRVNYRGQDSLAVPHSRDLTRLAINIGLPVPPPSTIEYDFNGGTPFDVQRKTVALLTLYDRAYVLNQFGTGKTKCAIWAFDYLKKKGEVEKALVVAPLSTLHNTWRREVFATAPHLSVGVLHAQSRQKRLNVLAENHDIYVINHDGVGVLLPEIMAKRDIDVIILDELALYRNNTDRTKQMRKLADTRKRVWGLTGAPTPNEPTDAWNQCKIVTPWTVPDSFTWFRNQVMLKKSTYVWVPKRGATEEVHRVMQPAVRFTLDDVVELPEVVMRTVPVQQGPLQERAYNALKTDLAAKFKAGEITASNSGVLFNKLLQVSLGWVYSDERGVIALDNQERLQSIVDHIEMSDRKVIVFSPFKHALRGLEAYFTSRKLETASVSGDTPLSERTRIFNAFQNTSKYRVLNAHPVCMSHGLTLTAADTIIWAAPYPSLDVFDQANARIRRVGQRHRQTVLMFSGTPEEAKAYKRLQTKANVQNLLLDMFAEQELLL